MRAWFWASRNDTDSSDINIHIRAQKPKRDKEYPENWYIYYYRDAEGDTEVCRKYFEKFTGIKLKPGECKKIQLTAEIL